MMALFDFPVLPGHPRILILVLHQEPAGGGDLPAKGKLIPIMGDTEDLAGGIGRRPDIAVAPADQDGSAAGRHIVNHFQTRPNGS